MEKQTPVPSRTHDNQSNYSTDSDDSAIDSASEVNAGQSSSKAKSGQICFAKAQIWENIRRCSTHSSFHGLPFLSTQRKVSIKVLLWIV